MAQDRSRKAPAWQLGVLDAREGALRLESVAADLRRRAAAMLQDPGAPDMVGASALLRAGCLSHLPKDAPWKLRAHLLACAAGATRRLFADRSRELRNGSTALRKTQFGSEPELDLDQLDRALTQFAFLDATMALAFELRLFACCDAQETARFIGASKGHFRRRWGTALAQLARYLNS